MSVRSVLAAGAILLVSLLISGFIFDSRVLIPRAAIQYVTSQTKSHRSTLESATSKLIEARKVAKGFSSLRHVNAGEKLNQWVTWPPATQFGSGFKPFLPSDDALSKLRAEFNGFGPAWTSHLADFAVDGLDLSWVRQLESADYWDVEASGPVQAALRKDAMLPPKQFPVPEFEELRVWGQASLVKTLKEKQDPVQDANVKAIWHLLITTESSKGIREALELYRRVVEAAQWYKSSVNTNYPLHFFRNYERLDTLASYLDSGKAFLDLVTDPNDLRDVFVAWDTCLFDCAIVNERIADLRRDRILLGSHFPEAAAVVDRMFVSGLRHCGLKQARRLWREDTTLPAELQSEHFQMPSMPEIRRVGLLSSWFSLLRPAGASDLPSILQASAPIRKAVGMTLRLGP
jgi:hypothetical protein